MAFLGELLTAMPNVSYFFEPLWFLARKNKSEEASISEVNQLYFGKVLVFKSFKVFERHFWKKIYSSGEKIPLQKIKFVAKLLNCRYHGMRRVMNNLKARNFVFKKPEVGSINLKTLGIVISNRNGTQLC